MTDPNIPEWSADPSAYAVEHRRNADGSLEALSVVSKATPTLLFAGYTARDGEDTGLDRILRLARDEERADGATLPSDLAIIRAALRDCDIEPVEAETVDALLHDALIVVKVDDGDPETMTGAEFVAANPDSRDEIAGLCAGKVDEVRLGGGAAPLVVVTLWPEGTLRQALERIARFPTDPKNRDLTHGQAVDAMAQIARDALAVHGDLERDEDALGRGLEPAEKPDCQPSNPDECPVCRGGRCRGEPS